jgi:MFS family permease
MLGPVVGGFIVSFFNWRMIFFVNLPIGVLGMLLVWRYLPAHRAERVPPLDVVGLVLFGAGTALLSYVLEVFGEHTLGTASILALLTLSALLLATYFLHARASSHPLLQLGLFRTRTFRSAVAGSFLTRLGAGGLPFLLPLLYQVGLGYSPVQSGLLLMPQSVAALGMKMTMPVILNRLGYRKVLVSNTLLMGSAIALFATVGRQTPVLPILLLSASFGFLASLQYTSMNTLAYADVSDSDASKASTIASTLQQMSLSFGVAAASLSAAIFIPDRTHSDPSQLVHGIHSALLALGALTALSTLIFRELRPNDGASVSRHASLHD